MYSNCVLLFFFIQNQSTIPYHTGNLNIFQKSCLQQCPSLVILEKNCIFTITRFKQTLNRSVSWLNCHFFILNSFKK